MNDVQRAVLRMLLLVPVDAPAPGTVDAVDLHTSLCDARAAVTLAAGGVPDVDGYRLPDAPGELVLFEVAA